MDRSYPSQGPIATTESYDCEPHLNQVNGDLLVIYRRARIGVDGHVDNTGELVARRSTDGGRDWSAPIPVANYSERDTRNHSVVVGEDRVVVFYRVIDAEHPADEREELGVYRVDSRDAGRSWSDPVDMTGRWGSDQVEWFNPFGGWATTSKGIVQLFYSGPAEYVVAVFSRDGGQTWDNYVPVISGESDFDVSILKNWAAASVSDREALVESEARHHIEPTPVAVDEHRIIAFGRENVHGDFWAAKSADGGLTWDEPMYFDPTDMDPKGTPICVERTGSNELTAVWGDRTNHHLYATHASADLVWQDPTRLCEAPIKPIHRQISDAGGHFSYPSMVQLGPAHRDCLVAFYDDGPAPDIWTLNLL